MYQLQNEVAVNRGNLNKPLPPVARRGVDLLACHRNQVEAEKEPLGDLITKPSNHVFTLPCRP